MKNYWWLCANPQYWDFSKLPLGESKPFSRRNGNGNLRQKTQNFAAARVGDLAIGYEARPRFRVVALLRVSRVDAEAVYVEKLESLSNHLFYKDLITFPLFKSTEFCKSNAGTLFRLTEEEYTFLLDLIREQNPLPTSPAVNVYGDADFCSEVYMLPERLNALKSVLEYRKNIILQGAPGVGKTHTARRLAYAMMGEMDDNRIEFIQFHQNYSYEDFVMGYRPDETKDGFVLKDGIFYRFCRKASDNPKQKYFFIIDEINRGNMSKIFGELLMLIEKDYRGRSMKLAYDNVSFTVPDNLYIIGMMNTADRSLAVIDYALRRRFSFVDMEPAFDVASFKTYQKQIGCVELVEKVKELNAEIEKDSSLGKGFCIGHSYFCGLEKEKDIPACLKAIVDYDILPMLREYWFETPGKAEKWKSELHGALK